MSMPPSPEHRTADELSQRKNQNRSDKRALNEPLRFADRNRRDISNPIKLQQHIRGGNDSDGYKSRAPARDGDDSTRQNGADGATDAV